MYNATNYSRNYDRDDHAKTVAVMEKLVEVLKKEVHV
jgi:hypothetical protein